MNDLPPTSPRPKRTKFKYTRELIRIATQDGMTQKEIADLCRVEQSVVSGWLNGKALAFEHQVTKLKRRYGSRLNRTTSRVYLTFGAAIPGLRWEDGERGREWLALAEETRSFERERSEAEAEAMRQAHARGEPDPLDFSDDAEPKHRRAAGALDPLRDDPFEYGASPPYKAEVAASLSGRRNTVAERLMGSVGRDLDLDTLIALDREEFETVIRPLQIVQVEGPIVLRYPFTKSGVEAHGREIRSTRKVFARWLVHHQARDRFVLVRQELRRLTGVARWRWEKELDHLERRAESSTSPTIATTWRKGLGDPVVDTADDAGRWVGELFGPVGATALLEFCDDYLRAPETRHDVHDELALPFLLRKALVELGYDVPGVERLVADD